MTPATRAAYKAIIALIDEFETNADDYHEAWAISFATTQLSKLLGMTEAKMGSRACHNKRPEKTEMEYDK